MSICGYKNQQIYGITNDNSTAFEKWVLDIGNSNSASISLLHDEDSDWVKLPDDLLLRKANGEMEDVQKA